MFAFGNILSHVRICDVFHCEDMKPACCSHLELVLGHSIPLNARGGERSTPFSLWQSWVFLPFGRGTLTEQKENRTVPCENAFWASACGGLAGEYRQLIVCSLKIKCLYRAEDVALLAVFVQHELGPESISNTTYTGYGGACL